MRQAEHVLPSSWPTPVPPARAATSSYRRSSSADSAPGLPVAGGTELAELGKQSLGGLVARDAELLGLPLARRLGRRELVQRGSRAPRPVSSISSRESSCSAMRRLVVSISASTTALRAGWSRCRRRAARSRRRDVPRGSRSRARAAAARRWPARARPAGRRARVRARPPGRRLPRSVAARAGRRAGAGAFGHDGRWPAARATARAPPGWGPAPSPPGNGRDRRRYHRGRQLPARRLLS
jgi:hypothetical protein